MCGKRLAYYLVHRTRSDTAHGVRGCAVKLALNVLLGLFGSPILESLTVVFGNKQFSFPSLPPYTDLPNPPVLRAPAPGIGLNKPQGRH